MAHPLCFIQTFVVPLRKLKNPIMSEQDKMVLRAEHLVKKYGKRTVVNDVSFDVKQGEIVGLLGPNGAGKTTSFYMIVGMVRPESGHIFLDDIEMTDKPMYKRARLGIGYLPQEASIFRKLSVEDNIMAILETQGMKRSERKRRLEQLLEEFKITHIRKTKSMSCSGGERRRLEIARALASDPSFLLLDEPFAGIDPIAVADIQSIISGLKDRGMGILITDHNVRETLSITDRAYIMYKSQVLTEGSSEYLANDPEARRIYLGDSFSLG